MDHTFEAFDSSAENKQQSAFSQKRKQYSFFKKKEESTDAIFDVRLLGIHKMSGFFGSSGCDVAMTLLQMDPKVKKMIKLRSKLEVRENCALITCERSEHIYSFRMEKLQHIWTDPKCSYLVGLVIEADAVSDKKYDFIGLKVERNAKYFVDYLNHCTHELNVKCEENLINDAPLLAPQETDVFHKKQQLFERPHSLQNSRLIDFELASVDEPAVTIQDSARPMSSVSENTTKANYFHEWVDFTESDSNQDPFKSRSPPVQPNLVGQNLTINHTFFDQGQNWPVTSTERPQLSDSQSKSYSNDLNALMGMQPEQGLNSMTSDVLSHPHCVSTPPFTEFRLPSSTGPPQFPAYNTNLSSNFNPQYNANSPNMQYSHLSTTNDLDRNSLKPVNVLRNWPSLTENKTWHQSDPFLL